MLLSQARKKQKAMVSFIFGPAGRRDLKMLASWPLTLAAHKLLLGPVRSGRPQAGTAHWPPPGGWGWEVWGHMMQGNPQEKEPQSQQKSAFSDYKPFVILEQKPKTHWRSWKMKLEASQKTEALVQGRKFKRRRTRSLRGAGGEAATGSG